MWPQPGTVKQTRETLATDKNLSLEQLAQQLRNVRQQQKALEAQEEELLKSIDLKVEEQRKALQKAEELRKQLRQEKPQADKKDIRRLSEEKEKHFERESGPKDKP
jgi:hypothetical protein